IILGGWEKARLLPLLDIMVSDASEEALRTLKMQFPQIHTLPGGNREAAWGDVVFLAIHPPVAGEVLATVRPTIRDDAIVVSLMPKVTIAQLCTLLGGFGRIVRMIPNAPSIIGQGYNPITLSPDIWEEERATLLSLFSPLGECPEVPEEHLEAYAVITAMGPPYLWFQMNEIVQIAREFGLSEKDARTGVGMMVQGVTRTMFSSGMKPEEVMDLVPVRPMGEDEQAIRDLYRSRLTALHAKLKG
ncbi:MAG: hypothetical protein LUQ69_06250, partial [Methanoregulaceae archaeon]|nr:hypothetical protein [Methanoregulaceae archaeon]